jgi:hypothetical protein
MPSTISGGESPQADLTDSLTPHWEHVADATPMFDRLPPLQTLRAFEATARLLSTTLAAEELHVTHGAVSRHIKTLENHLGVPLLLSLKLNCHLAFA